jgi:hypothetical protein
MLRSCAMRAGRSRKCTLQYKHCREYMVCTSTTPSNNRNTTSSQYHKDNAVMQCVFAQCNRCPTGWRIDARFHINIRSMLSGGVRGVVSVVVLWRWHLRLVDDASLLWWIGIEHDASLWRVGSERTGSWLAGVWKPL